MVKKKNEENVKAPPRAGRVILLAGMLAAVSLSHYYTNFRFEQIHDVYTRLYYIPIILAAFWFGVRGGIAAAAGANVLFLPHVLFQWRVHAAHGHFNLYIEMLMFVAVGVVTGVFADSEKRQRTRAQKAHAELEKSFDKAREAARLAAIGQLSASIAHEVRNPLAGIKGALEIISSDVDENNPKRRFVGIAHKEIARLESLVTDFLRFARPPAPEMAPDDINRVVRSVLELSRKHLSDNRISVNLRLADGISSSFMDSNQVRQVILNLVLNAAQAMPDGGGLTIVTCEENGNIRVDISDTGAGIPEGIAELIFAPFYTTRPDGTGLGLAVSRRIIRGHGGDITMRSRAGEGSTFTAALPVLKEAPKNDG